MEPRFTARWGGDGIEDVDVFCVARFMPTESVKEGRAFDLRTSTLELSFSGRGGGTRQVHQ